MIKQKCSNCGKDNEYTEKEWNGNRQTTLCKWCCHSLSVCFLFQEPELKKKK